MSRTINRGTCSTRPGNDDLSLELYPVYHAFTSAANLSKVMLELANDHPEISRFDAMFMRTLAEEVYAGSTQAQSAEGRVRKNNALLGGEVQALNEMYKWPLLRQMAADWAPTVRHEFLYKEGELLGSRPIYGAGKETGLDENLIQSRLGIMTNQGRCHTSEIPLTSWPLHDPASAPPTFANPNPLPLLPNRPDPQLGVRGNAPGVMQAQPERLMPGPMALELCTQRQCIR